MDKPFEEYTLDEIPEGEHLRLWENHDWSTQEERFAREFIRCQERVKAYVFAFPEQRGDARQNIYNRSRKLLFQPWMQDYLAFVADRQKAIMRRGADDILDRISEIMNANMSDFYSVQEDGSPQWDLSGITREQSAAIQELQIDTYMTGKGDTLREVRSMKVKLAPKTAAMELLGKNQKLFTDVLEHANVGDEIEEMRRARERARKLREAREAGDEDDGEIKGDNVDD